MSSFSPVLRQGCGGQESARPEGAFRKLSVSRRVSTCRKHRANYAKPSADGLTAIESLHGKYIKGQEEHHRRTIFVEEYRTLLEEAGIGFDERYML
jgi:hypothetical protein